MWLFALYTFYFTILALTPRETSHMHTRTHTLIHQLKDEMRS